MKLFLLILSAIIIYSCSNSIKPKKTSILIDKKILDDSSFVSFSTCINHHDGAFYVSDFKNNRVLVLNKNLGLERTIGSTGKGPGELISISQLYIYNDSLFVYDPNQYKLIVYDLFGKFIKEIKPQYPILRKFFVKDGKIYCSHPYSEKPIVIMTMDGKLFKSFGKLSDKHSDEEKHTTNQWDVLYDGKNIITVNVSDPMIDIYDYNELKIKKRIDLTENEIFRSMYDYKNRKLMNDPNMKKSATFYLITDSYYYDKEIYLLCMERNEKSYNNKILRCNYNGDLNKSFIQLRSVDGAHHIYSSFSIVSDTILTCDLGTGELTLYKTD